MKPKGWATRLRLVEFLPSHPSQNARWMGHPNGCGLPDENGQQQDKSKCRAEVSAWCFVESCWLVVAEGDHGVDAGGSPGWNVAGEQGDCSQYEDHAEEGDWVGWG